MENDMLFLHVILFGCVFFYSMTEIIILNRGRVGLVGWFARYGQ